MTIKAEITKITIGTDFHLLGEDSEKTLLLSYAVTNSLHAETLAEIKKDGWMFYNHTGYGAKVYIRKEVSPTPIDTIDLIDFLASAVNFYILSCKAFKHLEIEDSFHWNASESKWYKIKIVTAFCMITISQLGAITVHTLPEMNTSYPMSIDKAQRLGSDLQRAALIAQDLQRAGEFSLGSESFSCSWGVVSDCPF